ncbi:MAG TPA: hypothetical protein VMS77_08280 [Conexivisphaerales archaeon]|nr:hypothetical protein [Conexivisphaerales archaeon]
MRRSLFVKLGTTSDVGDFLEKTVAQNLRERGFSLQTNRRGCDIVAERDGMKVIVECKMNVRRSNWFQVLNQVRGYREKLKPDVTVLLVGNMRIFRPLWDACSREGIRIVPCWAMFNESFPFLTFDLETGAVAPQPDRRETG